MERCPRPRLVPLRACSLLLASLVCLATAQAASVTVSWRANDEPDLAGYHLYLGPASGVYGAPIPVDAEATSYQLTDLSPGTIYYLALTAFDESGLESDYSAEISFGPLPAEAAPSLFELRPAVASPGETVALLGAGLGETPEGSILRLGRKRYRAGSSKIILWSDTEVHFRLPAYGRWPQGTTRTRRVWVQVGGLKSNRLPLTITKP
jgi:hypothetical protein